MQIMKIDSSNLLTEDSFWDIIERSLKAQNLDGQKVILEQELLKLSEQEIFGFWYHYSKFSRVSYLGNLWLVPYIVMSGCSDDGFDYFRDWLISRGKKVFLEALENPDSLCYEFDNIAEGDIPEFEGMGYLWLKVFEEKFHKDFYEEAQNYEDNLPKLPDISFEWEEDNEASMKKTCPCIFEKWWDNDRF